MDEKKLKDQAFSFILTEIDDSVPKEIFEELSKTVQYAKVEFFTQEDGMFQIFSQSYEEPVDFWEAIVKVRPVGISIDNADVKFKITRKDLSFNEQFS